MAVLYKTVGKEALAEQSIERSRFIAHIKPAASREEAEAFIADIRREHRAATHNVPAYIIGDKMQLQWCSDDGEPQGTSGVPMLQLLVKEGLSNLCLVVTRYFGGTKLGTGGLVRAYSSSARLALDAAGIVEIRDHEELETELSYSLLARLQNAEKNMPFELIDIEYAALLKVRLRFEAENRADIEAFLQDLTGGGFLKNTPV